MKRIKEMDLLNNNDQKIIDRINEEYPPSDENEKEKIFRMTMEKYNRRKNAGGSEETEMIVSGVERYRKFTWTRFAGAAAACLAIIAGTAATVHLTRNGNGVPDISQTSQAVTTIAGTNAAGVNDNTVSTVAVSAETYAVPFGKMADYDYCLCSDYEVNELAQQELPQAPLVIRLGDDSISVFAITDTLSGEKRSALDIFFSSQKWDELSGEKMISDNTEQETVKPLFTFAAKTDKSVRIIRINNDNSLFFNEIPCTNNDGILYTDVDSINKDGENYKIDSALFKSSVEAILNGSTVPAPTEAISEAPADTSAVVDTAEATESAAEKGAEADAGIKAEPYSAPRTAPFGNFNDMDFRFAYANDGNPVAEAANTLTEPDYNTRLLFRPENNDTIRSCWFTWDTPIPADKKERIADIFNSCEWVECSEADMDNMTRNSDTFSLMCTNTNDDKIYSIKFMENNVMIYSVYTVTGIIGDDDYIVSGIQDKYYKIDYMSIRNAVADAITSEDTVYERWTDIRFEPTGTNDTYKFICVYDPGNGVSYSREIESYTDYPYCGAFEFSFFLEFNSASSNIQTATLIIVNTRTNMSANVGRYTYDSKAGSVTTVFEDPQAAYSAVQ